MEFKESSSLKNKVNKQQRKLYLDSLPMYKTLIAWKYLCLIMFIYYSLPMWQIYDFSVSLKWTLLIFSSSLFLGFTPIMFYEKKICEKAGWYSKHRMDEILYVDSVGIHLSYAHIDYFNVYNEPSKTKGSIDVYPAMEYVPWNSITDIAYSKKMNRLVIKGYSTCIIYNRYGEEISVKSSNKLCIYPSYEEFGDILSLLENIHGSPIKSTDLEPRTKYKRFVYRRLFA